MPRRARSSHHNALDHDFFLRISLGCTWRLIIGGFDAVFRGVGRNFRNEGGLQAQPEYDDGAVLGWS